MTDAELNERDVHFIRERVLKYLKATQDPNTLMKYISEQGLDALYHIPDSKIGMIIIGREASQRMVDIARRFLSGQPREKRKTTPSKFAEKLEVEFSLRFIRGYEEATEVNINAMIAAAFDACATEHEAIRHFIPCAIILGQSAPRFSVGPVTFVQKVEFFATHKDDIEALRADIRERHLKLSQESAARAMPANVPSNDADSQECADHLVDGFVSFFEEFQWVAIVDISECDASVSYDRALFLTRSALNIIKLLLGARYTHRLRTAEDRGHSHEAARLKRGSDGKLGVSLSYTPKDNVGGENWQEMMRQCGRFFTNACRVLELCADFADAPPLCTRFVDALSWYGDATTEHSPAAKIIKFVTAIEGITRTGFERDEFGNKRGVTKVVTLRAGIVHSMVTEGKLDDSMPQVSAIYGCRSGLVHGSTSPFDDIIAETVPKAAEMARFILLGGLDYFCHLGIEDMEFNPEELSRRYRLLEKWHGTHTRDPMPGVRKPHDSS
jgi:hypothetical protein